MNAILHISYPKLTSRAKRFIRKTCMRTRFKSIHCSTLDWQAWENTREQPKDATYPFQDWAVSISKCPNIFTWFIATVGNNKILLFHSSSHFRVVSYVPLVLAAHSNRFAPTHLHFFCIIVFISAFLNCVWKCRGKCRLTDISAHWEKKISNQVLLGC